MTVRMGTWRLQEGEDLSVCSVTFRPACPRGTPGVVHDENGNAVGPGP